MSNTYLININGKDAPSKLKHITKTLNLFKGEVLDINQAVIYKTLSVEILIKLPSNILIDDFFKEVLYTCHKLNLHVTFEKIDFDKNYPLNDSFKKRYIITALAKNLTSNHLHSLIDLILKDDVNVISIERLSKPKLNSAENEGVSCIEITLEGKGLDLEKIRREFLILSQKGDIDLGIQEDTPYRRHRRLIAFDMDSTLIQTEVIDELAKRKGVYEEVKRITERAMHGELDFKESLKRRVALLKGLEASVLFDVAKNLPLTDGALKLIKNLKILGYKIAIISGGFTFFGEYLKKRLNIDYVFANELEIKDNVLTGKVVGDIIDGEKKAEILKKLARIENISLEQVIAVGDGANDLPMLNLAGLGIAFRAKPIVREGAKQSLTNVGLDAILYFLGIRDREVVA
ncbi:phosphoserine phosphatase SerB [Desulfothermus sp.]